jgi:hypothetical protein
VRAARGAWWAWLGAFLAIDVAVAVLAISPLASAPPVRLSFEGGAMCLSALSAVVLLVRRIGAPVMRLYFIATLFFAQSSLGFLLARPWNHQWWLAHVIFASGFFLLSYGVIRAFLTTGAFSTVDAAVSQPPGDRDLRGPEPSTMLSRS